MEKALQGKPVEVFPVPPGIVFSRVDSRSGVPVKKGARGAIYECFLEGTIPGNAPPVDASDMDDAAIKPEVVEEDNSD